MNNNIKNYSFYPNDDGTYIFEIAYGDGYSVSYPRVRVDYIGNNVIAFPVTIQVLHEYSDEVINTFTMLKTEQDNTESEDSNTVENETQSAPSVPLDKDTCSN